ncbi:hypothetical protein OG585_33450 [Streptomyces sp. NBC_01340]|uniref:hypothetical protein n=1 Tax=Streptomyces sp. NBC_01340 TaxID=2903830 RepID=UPI002E0D1FC7|nr:hypothetical protein OG585_33450 [Streptomyces sp. NBC_01340]
MALFLLLVIVAIVLGIIGVVAKGLFYLLSSACWFWSPTSSSSACAWAAAAGIFPGDAVSRSSAPRVARRVWEVPNAAVANQARRILGKQMITNIRVRIVP